MDYRGPRGVRELLAEFLGGPLVSATLQRMRGQWGLDELDLPNAARVLPFDAQALDTFPLFAASAVRVPRMRRSEVDDGQVTYESTYSCRVYCWVREEGRDRVVNVRDDLVAALLVALLDHPTLGRTDTVVDEGSARVEPSDVTSVNGERFVAGAYIAFDVRVEERLTRDRLGVAETFTADVTVYSSA